MSRTRRTYTAELKQQAVLRSGGVTLKSASPEFATRGYVVHPLQGKVVPVLTPVKRIFAGCRDVDCVPMTAKRTTDTFWFWWVIRVPPCRLSESADFVATALPDTLSVSRERP